MVGPADIQCCVWKMLLLDPVNNHCLKCGVGFDILWRVECCMSLAMHPRMWYCDNIYSVGDIMIVNKHIQVPLEVLTVNLPVWSV